MELRNILKDVNIDNLTAANLKSVGGPVFADIQAKKDLNDLVNIQTAWAAVHAPTFGQAIPSTGTTAAVDSLADDYVKMLAPTTNEIYRVSGFWVLNDSESATTFTGYMVDTNSDVKIPVTALAVTIGAEVTVFVPLVSPISLMVDKNITVYGKTAAADMTMGALAIKITQ
jgi:hypothetical protein